MLLLLVTIIITAPSVPRGPGDRVRVGPERRQGRAAAHLPGLPALVNNDNNNNNNNNNNNKDKDNKDNKDNNNKDKDIKFPGPSAVM